MAPNRLSKFYRKEEFRPVGDLQLEFLLSGICLNFTSVVQTALPIRNWSWRCTSGECPRLGALIDSGAKAHAPHQKFRRSNAMARREGIREAKFIQKQFSTGKFHYAKFIILLLVILIANTAVVSTAQAK